MEEKFNRLNYTLKITNNDTIKIMMNWIITKYVITDILKEQKSQVPRI
jgi:hypothetical protein